MITLAPNVYVAKYLKATGKMTPDQRERIINNMVVGLKGTVRGGCGMQRWSTTKWG
ncbi:unnamed protein product [Durusdinium trenchii]|uniref:Alpha-macroglobulin-like TED domain-containing protein n=2 Tax=Durusdinium trenchii TaxID=1381693 RepID=A0ABP0J322_9DINO